MSVLGLGRARGGGGSGPAGGGSPDGSGGGGSGATSGGARRSGSTRVGRANVADPDVGVGDRGVRNTGLEVGGLARGGGAVTASSTESGRVDGVGGVEPKHVGVVIVPEGESKDQTVAHGLLHSGEATLALVRVGVAEDGLLGVAEGVGEGIDGLEAGNVDLGVLDDLAILDVEAANLSELAGRGAVVSNELGHKRKLLVGVDGLSGTKEGLVAQTVGVEIAAVGVANTIVTVSGGVAFRSAAPIGSGDRARVGCKGIGDLVGLPDIKLVAAGSVLSVATVGIGSG